VNKGQLLTVDYIIGVMLFMLLLTACLYVWENILYKIQEDQLTLELMNTAKRISDQFVRTSGNPNNWESNVSAASSVGIAIDDRVISQAKFAELAGMNYSNLRYYLGVGSFDVYLKLSNTSGSVFGEAGNRPAEALVVNTRRIVSMDNQTALLDVSVWSPEVGNVLTPIT